MWKTIAVLLLGLAQAGLAAEPRIAKYGCRSYRGGTSAPLFLGYLTLTSAKDYEWVGKKTGTYRFDVAANRFDFLTGTLLEQGIVGNFDIEREGKTHRIILVPKDGSKTFRMVCTNSTD